MADMCEDVLLIDDRDAVRILRMNRPAKRNALNTALTRALHDALVAADADDGVRAIVLTGEGRAFCAGADIGEFDELTPADPDAVIRRADLTSRTQMLPQLVSKPTISVVQGAALGGGAGLAIACDMMVAATDLLLGYPELRHSIVPAIVMTGLQRQLGRKLAFELITTGRTLGAAEAVELGLANHAAEPGRALEVGLEIATSWARASPLAMSTTKSLFHRVADLPFAEAMRAGRDANVLMRGFRGCR